MSRKLKIVIPGPAGLQLDELAETSGEPTATLAARFVVNGISRRDATPRSPQPSSSARRVASSPRWLAPAQDAARWREELWGAVTALHTRYPRQLARVQDAWWEDPAQREILAALATWRAEIDASGEDPREELLFHAQLTDYQRTLETQAAGVARAWQPGAPPSGWGEAAPDEPRRGQ